MKDVVKKWENAAAVYTESQEASELAESNKAVVKARFDRMNGERALDLGCGYGYYSDYFDSIGANALGVDGSEKMIEIARGRYPSTEFVIADIEKRCLLKTKALTSFFQIRCLWISKMSTLFFPNVIGCLKKAVYSGFPLYTPVFTTVGG